MPRNEPQWSLRAGLIEFLELGGSGRYYGPRRRFCDGAPRAGRYGVDARIDVARRRIALGPREPAARLSPAGWPTLPRFDAVR